MRDKSYFFAIIAVLFWSTVATAFSIALKNLHLYIVLFISVTTSAVVLLFAVLLTGKIGQIFNPKDVWKSSIYGFLNPFIYYLVLFRAYSSLKIQVAQGLNYTWPIVLSLLSIMLLKQKFMFKDLLSLSISFVGALVLILGAENGEKVANDYSGVFFALLSSIIWSFYWILNMKDKRDENVKLFLNFFFGSIYIAILMFFTKSFSVPSRIGLFSSIYIGFFEMSFSFLLWIQALKNSEKTSKVANFIYLTPFISLVFIYFVSGEEIKLTTVIGLVIILAGIYSQNFTGERHKRQNAFSR